MQPLPPGRSFARGLVASLLACLTLASAACEGDAPAAARRSASSSSGGDPAAADGGGAPAPGGDAQAPAGDAAAPPCAPIAGAAYDALAPTSAPTDRPAAAHADLNVTMRKTEVATGAARALVDLAGATDPSAPKLRSLFAPAREPPIAEVLRVQDWSWATNSPGAFVTDPEVTMVDLAATDGELLHMPTSGYDIGGGHGALVLYATVSTITLKLTRDDNVVGGYTLHLDRVCVDPALVSAYDAANAGGRKALPALRTSQAFARARGATVRVAVRDTGSFMDPRSRKDWW